MLVQAIDPLLGSVVQSRVVGGTGPRKWAPGRAVSAAELQVAAGEVLLQSEWAAGAPQVLRVSEGRAFRIPGSVQVLPLRSRQTGTACFQHSRNRPAATQAAVPLVVIGNAVCLDWHLSDVATCGPVGAGCRWQTCRRSTSPGRLLPPFAQKKVQSQPLRSDHCHRRKRGFSSCTMSFYYITVYHAVRRALHGGEGDGLANASVCTYRGRVAAAGEAGAVFSFSNLYW